MMSARFFLSHDEMFEQKIAHFGVEFSISKKKKCLKCLSLFYKTSYQ